MLSLTRADVRTIAITTILGMIIGALYTHFTYLSRPDAEGAIWIGIGIGASIGFLISYFEILFVGRPYSHLRQLPFWLALIIRTVAHFGIVFFSVRAWQAIYQYVANSSLVIIGENVNDTVMDMTFSLAIVMVIVFGMQMRLFIGGGYIANLILGKYNQPRIEQRIFMIVDVVGSTAFAQKAGDVNFHKYLNRIFILLDDPIHKNGGMVHSYVGDAIFAVWPVFEDRVRNARPLKALMEFREDLLATKENFASEFGIEPEIRVAIHKGNVVAGETGYRKRQITLLGNTVNLVSRIESLTKTGIGTYLASAEYLESCEVPDGIAINDLGDFEIKGSERAMNLFRISLASAS